MATSALQRAGGFACIKDRIIDDVNLAKTMKGEASPIQLALSRTEVKSLRVYESIETIWVMVRRTAFTERANFAPKIAKAIISALGARPSRAPHFGTIDNNPKPKLPTHAEPKPLNNQGMKGRDL